MGDIQFVEELPDDSYTGKATPIFTAEVQDALRSNPGKWAVIRERSFDTVRRRMEIRRGMVDSAKRIEKRSGRMGFKFEVRVDDAGQFVRMFARYKEPRR